MKNVRRNFTEGQNKKKHDRSAFLCSAVPKKYCAGSGKLDPIKSAHICHINKIIGTAASPPWRDLQQFLCFLSDLRRQHHLSGYVSFFYRYYQFQNRRISADSCGWSATVIPSSRSFCPIRRRTARPSTASASRTSIPGSITVFSLIVSRFAWSCTE